MANKITERELYNSILNGTVDQAVLCDFAEKKLAQLDRRNASAAKRAAVKRAENSGVVAAVYALLGSEPMTRDAVAEAYGGELSVAKIGAKLNALVADGRIQKTNIKVAGTDGKTSSKVGYFIAE